VRGWRCAVLVGCRCCCRRGASPRSSVAVIRPTGPPSFSLATGGEPRSRSLGVPVVEACQGLPLATQECSTTCTSPGCATEEGFQVPFARDEGAHRGPHRGPARSGGPHGEQLVLHEERQGPSRPLLGTATPAVGGCWPPA